MQVEFNPAVVSYDQLLEIFWNIHDPTQLNRQGPDIGTNYRSAIFYHSEEQKAKAEASRDRLKQTGKFRDRPIVTEVVPASKFWRAEEYHQQYFEKSGQGYCAIPKYWE